MLKVWEVVCSETKHIPLITSWLELPAPEDEFHSSSVSNTLLAKK